MGWSMCNMKRFNRNTTYNLQYTNILIHIRLTFGSVMSHDDEKKSERSFIRFKCIAILTRVFP